MRFLFAMGLVGLLVAGGCARQPQKSVSAAGAKKGSGDSYYFLIRSNLESYQGDTLASLQDLEKGLKTDPANPYLRYAAAERHAEARDFNKAAENIQEALKARPDWLEAKALWGRILEARGESFKAAAIFEELIRQKPDEEDGYLRLAQALVDQKKFQPAIAVLNRWLSRRADSVAAHFYIATIRSVYLNDTAGAVKTFQKILELDPDNVRVRVQLGSLYLQQNKMQQALAEFLKVESAVSQDLGIQLQIASIYYEMGRYEEAVRRLEDVLKTNPRADRIHYYLGLIYEKLGKQREALLRFADVPPASGLYKDAKLHEASVYRDQKKPGDAISTLRLAIRKAPKMPEFYQFLSLIYEEEGDLGKAADILKKAIHEIPDQEAFYFSLGILYDKMKQKDQSVAMMEKVLALNPDNASALNYIGYIYAEQGTRLDEAESLVSQALKLKPGDGYILDSLAWVYFQKGDFRKALQYIRKAYKVQPREATISEHYGDILLKEGKKAEALKFYKRAFEFAKQREEKDSEEIQRVEEKISKM